MPLRLRSDDGELQLITTLTSFATTLDVTVSELRLEAFLPADGATAAVLQRRAERYDPARSRRGLSTKIVSTSASVTRRARAASGRSR